MASEVKRKSPPLPASLAKTLRALRRRFPLRKGMPLEVRVVVRVPEATYAAALVEDGKAAIWIRRERSATLMLHSLIHEYAHVWAWSWYSDHPDIWGVAYARCYRAIIEDKRVRPPSLADVRRAVDTLARRAE